MESLHTHPGRFITIGILSIIVVYLGYMRLNPGTQTQASMFTCPAMHECTGAKCACANGVCTSACPMNCHNT